MTGDSLYFDNFMQGGLKCVRYEDIVRVTVHEGKRFSPDKLVLITPLQEYILDACIDGLNLNTIQTIFDYIIEKAKSSEEPFSISEQGVLSYQLPESLKLSYLKVLCNYAYINDDIIDSKEYNAITKISIRMEVEGETRSDLRIYMNDNAKRVKSGYFLRELKKSTENETGYWDAIKYCMTQDALYIHDVQSPGKDWREDGFLGSLKNQCELTEEQMDSMVYAVKLNKKMLLKDADMAKLKQEWKKFTASVKNTKGYVPSRYLFCSGSVYGIKSYNGFLKKDETSQSAINKQRELILQELIINNQKSVNVLIGDMNYLAARLEKALETEEKIQQDYDNIKILLNRIKAAMSTVKEEEEYNNSMLNN
ncbi:MAG: hypothetical protein LUI14_07430 [Lachnospiraceae bacterium]|nr:hypothetical protein [Lachnospiraceae bacterium]